MQKAPLSPYYNRIIFLDDPLSQCQLSDVAITILEKKPKELPYISSIQRKVCLHALKDALEELSAARNQLSLAHEKIATLQVQNQQIATEQVASLVKNSSFEIVEDIECLLENSEVKESTYLVAQEIVKKLMEWKETKELNTIHEITASFNPEENDVDFSLPKYHLSFHLNNDSLQLIMMKISFDVKWTASVDAMKEYTKLDDTFFNDLFNYVCEKNYV